MSRKKSTKSNKWEVVIYNDNIHSFDDIIEMLMDFCGHNYYQALQCATLIHNKKKYPVFIDKHEVCLEVYNELHKLGVDVVMASHNSK